MGLLTLAVIAAVATACLAEEQTYNVFALEAGMVVHETITTDKEANIVRMKMPAHNGLDAVDSLLDYTRGLQVRHFPDKKQCAVNILNTTDFAEPQFLEPALRKQQGELWVNTPNTTATYRILGPFISDHMTKEMMDLCADSQVVWVQEVKERVIGHRGGLIFTKQENSREKRGLTISKCRPDLRVSACLIIERYCHYIKICRREKLPGVQQEVTACDGLDHKFGKNECCISCCSDPLKSDRTSPACDIIQEADVRCGDYGQSALAAEQCKPNPCQNGGTCIHGIGRYQCHCAPGYHGKQCQQRR